RARVIRGWPTNKRWFFSCFGYSGAGPRHCPALLPGCTRKRTKRTLNKNIPRGVAPWDIFIWNFFGSFFAKKEHPLLPVGNFDAAVQVGDGAQLPGGA